MGDRPHLGGRRLGRRRRRRGDLLRAQEDQAVGHAVVADAGVNYAESRLGRPEVGQRVCGYRGR